MEKVHESSPKGSIFKKVHERHVKLKILYRASMYSKQMECIKEYNYNIFDKNIYFDVMFFFWMPGLGFYWSPDDTNYILILSRKCNNKYFFS